MRRLSVLAVAITLLAAAAGAAVAGEVKGPRARPITRTRTAAPSHANSACRLQRSE